MLDNIIFTNKIYLIGNNYSFDVLLQPSTNFKITIPKGNYDGDELAAIMKTQFDDSVIGRGKIDVKFDKAEEPNKIRMEAKANGQTFVFSNYHHDLARVLGLGSLLTHTLGPRELGDDYKFFYYPNEVDLSKIKSINV